MDENNTGRLEAFSDGVFAVAITLLVLDFKVPPIPAHPQTGQLAQALDLEWPFYLSYVISFMNILIMWLNHHRLFKNIARTDHMLLLLNGLLLMVITLVPFSTSLLSIYLPTPDARAATAVYSGVLLAMAVAFNVLWRYASTGERLLYPDHDREQVQWITKQYRFGPLFYIPGFLFAFVWPPLSVAISFFLAIFFAFPDRPNRIKGSVNQKSKNNLPM